MAKLSIPPLKPVLIASDHAGLVLKQFIQKHLPEHQWIDLGPFTEDSVDYPDFAQKLATKVAKGEATAGVLICGTGIGMSIAANKISGVRAALVENLFSARMTREHNNSNVLCLGSRIVGDHYAVEIVRTWLNTPFPEDSRHSRRINKITALEDIQNGQSK